MRIRVPKYTFYPSLKKNNPFFAGKKGWYNRGLNWPELAGSNEFL
jgi:hypothetical protein